MPNRNANPNPEPNPMPNQEFGLVPIVEPEILIDGSHDIATTARIQERVLTTVYAKLQVPRTLALAPALALARARALT